MIEIRHKETNEQISHVGIDSVLDTSYLHDIDGKIRNALIDIYNKDISMFHYQDSELGTITCKSLPPHTFEEMQNYFKDRQDEFPKDIDNFLTVHIPGSDGLMVCSCGCNNKKKFPELEDDWKPFLDPWFQMFGYDGFTLDTYKFLECERIDIFWDTVSAYKMSDYTDVNRKFEMKPLKFNQPLHIDQDEFMWFRVGKRYVDGEGKKFGKGLIGMGLNQERIPVDNYGILCPGGTWHATADNSMGVSMRVAMNQNFLTQNSKFSEVHNKWIEYVRSFTYKPKLIRGSTNNYGWLDIVEYSEANILPGWLSGGWYEPGHEDNIPTSITPFICEEK